MSSGKNSSKQQWNSSVRSRVSDESAGKDRNLNEKLDEIYAMLSTLITKRDMDSKLLSLKEAITTENKELIDKLEWRIFDLEEENEGLKVTVTRLEQKISVLEDREKILNQTQNDLEQQGRKNSIRIIGLEDPDRHEKVEDCVKKVVEFLGTKLNVSVTESDIDIAHRLGTYQQNKPRTVICKFTHRRKKAEVIRARRILKGQRYCVFEDLTRINQERLKAIFNLDCVKHSYSIDGKLFAQLKDGKKEE
ncbi:uncharacterized protein LOC110464476 [Mizuhopecten yessoensis]|uniref:uncharacterized protein LOC110464476 n=1 Tax=Mizuhopecten yessoensis TaxID=6573 RepID=UPI000B45A038|nr:uncharacterized protein LOC110464476 [Mizuhopecten yessoensis]